MFYYMEKVKYMQMYVLCYCVKNKEKYPEIVFSLAEHYEQLNSFISSWLRTSIKKHPIHYCWGALYPVLSNRFYLVIYYIRETDSR